jgi:type II secretory pathway component PulF
MNYEAALQETFLKMDEMLLSVEGKQEIVEINKQNPANISQLERALVASGSLKGKLKYILKKLIRY